MPKHTLITHARIQQSTEYNEPSSAGRPDNELFDRSRKDNLRLQAPTGYSFSW
jgi:hypothetical protein